MNGFPIGYRLSFVAAGSAELHFASERLVRARFVVVRFAEAQSVWAHFARAYSVAAAGPRG